MICFQEVGECELAALRSHALSQSHRLFWVPNALSSASQKNGVATLLSHATMDVVEQTALQLGGTTGAALVRCRRRLDGACAELVVLNCHLDYGGDVAARQVREAAHALDGAQCGGAPPRLLWCGDFNVPPNAAAMATVRDELRFADVFGFSNSPTSALGGDRGAGARLDYVLYKGPRLTPAAAPRPGLCGRGAVLPTFSGLEDLLRAAGSDHVPLAVAFDLEAGDGEAP